MDAFLHTSCHVHGKVPSTRDFHREHLATTARDSQWKTKAQGNLAKLVSTQG